MNRRKSLFHTQLTPEESEIYLSVKSYFQEQSEIEISNENPKEPLLISQAIFKRIYQEFTEVNNDADPSTLTKEEFSIVIHQKSPHLTETQIDELFSIFDDNGDGKVDIKEYCFQMLNNDCEHPELKEIREDMHWLKKVVDHEEKTEVDLEQINKKLQQELLENFSKDEKSIKKSVSIFQEDEPEPENLTILALKYKNGKVVRARF